MSDATKEALDAAIQAHVLDETDGGLLTGYFCQTQFTSADLMDEGADGFQRIVAEHQNMTTTLGLITYARRQMDFWITASFEDDDD